MTSSRKDRNHKYAPEELPGPGIKKKNPKELDRELDVALEQTMDASDPPAVTLPEVKRDRTERRHRA